MQFATSVVALLVVSAQVELVDCAADVFDLPAVREALRIDSTTADCRLRISLPNCDDTVRLDVTGQDGASRTATVSLQDVPPKFRYRTLAFVVSDLVTQGVAPGREPSKRAPTSTSIAVAAGATVRGNAQPDATVAAAPFVQAHVDWAMTRVWGARVSTTHEFISTSSHWYYGGRFGVGPRLRHADGTIVIDTAVQYYGGFVLLRGRGENAISRVAVAPVHGAVFDLKVGVWMWSAGSIDLLAAVGFEWGVEGQRSGEPLVSTHGVFSQFGLAITF